MHLKKVQKNIFAVCLVCCWGVGARGRPGRAHGVVTHALEAAVKDAAGTLDLTRD